MSALRTGRYARCVMGMCGMMGEVVGMAAALCKQHDCMPRAIYEAHSDELKRLKFD